MLKRSAIAKCNTAIIEGVLVPPSEVKLLYEIYSNREQNESLNTSIRIHCFTKNNLPSTTHSLLNRLVKKKLIHKHEVKDIYNPKKNKKIYMLDNIVFEFFIQHKLHK